MKVALRGANGLYVAAENGGGLDTRVPGITGALRCNRAERGPWETFELEFLDVTYCRIRTSGGFYVTAESGGGSTLRTNEVSPGVWETFAYLPDVGMFVTWDGQHCLGVPAGALDPIVDATAVFVGFTVEQLEQPLPPRPQTRVWKGAFCIPRALPGLPFGGADANGRIWTPAYGCYDDGWRANIRAAYVSRGYTHFPYNCAGLPYGEDYPELADDSARVARDLTELMAAGLIPVVCATDDRNPWVLCESFVINAGLVVVCFPCWEMNGPLGDDDKDIEEQNCKNAILRTRDAAPDAECYLHFTPGHGSISYADEIGGWQWCQANGTVGLLAQGSNRFAAEPADVGGRGLESTAVRLAGLTELGAPPAWAGVNQLTVKFEYGIWDMYHGTVSEMDACNYTQAFLAYAPHVSGYCDGGF